MATNTRSLLNTELGRKLVREAAETILSVLGTMDIPDDGTPVRDGAFSSPARSVAHETPAASSFEGTEDVLNTRAPKTVENTRILSPRAFYTAGRPGPRANLTGLTPATTTILNTLVSSRRRLTVVDLMESTSLKRKTVENALSLLRQRGLLSQTETSR